MDSFAGRQAVIHLARTGRIDELRQLADAGDPKGCRQLAAVLVRTERIREVRERIENQRFDERLAISPPDISWRLHAATAGSMVECDCGTR
ncbi:hypothetical protein AB0L82_12915 [Nocardia sp. NPDC052001]|uniref:hypothetical protein n=1 Tax=Nocardia sp. NPDC052001 TaxID=3154853 RepID=UPI003444F530